LEDGNIDFLGRVDRQVKIRGYRIEPGEVEAVLAQAPGIGDVAVLAREDTPGDKRLVAYVRARTGEELDGGQVRGFARERLPEYMVPAAFVVLEEFPLTANGKVNREALPAPSFESSDAEHGYVAPRTELEGALASIWAEVLHLPRVGIHDNFFELGGDSILATNIVHRCSNVTKNHLRFRDIFKHPTVARLVESLKVLEQKKNDDESNAAQTDPILLQPLSFEQKSLWIAGQTIGDSTSLNVPILLHLTGSLDESRLRGAIKSVLKRHEMLRTRIVQLPDGQPGQIVDREPEVDSIYATHVAKSDTDTKAIIQRQSSKAFSLGVQHGIRIDLIRRAPQEHWLLINMHHIITDRISCGLFIDDLFSSYRNPETIRYAPASYVEYVKAQQAQALSSEHAEGIHKLQKRLANYEPALAPDAAGTKGASDPFEAAESIPAETFNALVLRAKQANISVTAAVVASVAGFLARFTHTQDCVLFVPTTTRPREYCNCIGCFVQLLPVRVGCNQGCTFASLMSTTMEAILVACDEGYLSPEQGNLSRGCHPVIRYEALTPIDGTAGELTYAQEDTPDAKSKYDLTFVLEKRMDGIAIRVASRGGLFLPQTLEEMAARYVTVLAQFVQDPQQPLTSAGLMDSSEEAEIRSGWSQHRGQKQIRIVADQISARVAAAPTSVAIRHNELQVTYGELNSLATRIAQSLRQSGVKYNDRVGVCLGRSIELVSALLGIWKAGAAYVPLDPELPHDRLHYMINDASIDVIVTSNAFRDQAAILSKRLCFIEDSLSQQDDDISFPVHPGSLAYVIYTSGSTGRPKGVAVTHENLAGFIHGCLALEDFQQSDVWSACHSFAFDVSGWEMFGPLCIGGAIAIIDSEMLRDPVGQYLAMQRMGVTICAQTPSAYRTLKSAVDSALERSCQSIRVFMFAGEPIRYQDIIPLVESGVKVWDLYGPTEATVYITAHEVIKDDLSGKYTVIGQPLNHAGIYVLDEEMKPTPYHLTGNIYIGGGTVARGYINDAARTAAAFLPDPYSTLLGARMYRSGDLGRQRRDGSVEYVGRADHQVKVRGYRLELAEIEAILGGEPFIEQVAVTVNTSGTGLTAYIVPSRTEAKWIWNAIARSEQSEIHGCVLPNGALVQCEDSNQAYRDWGALESCLKAVDREGEDLGCVVDCNAEDGIFPVLLASYSPASTVYAFSNAQRLRHLKANCTLFEANAKVFDSASLQYPGFRETKSHSSVTLPRFIDQAISLAAADRIGNRITTIKLTISALQQIHELSTKLETGHIRWLFAKMQLDISAEDFAHELRRNGNVTLSEKHDQFIVIRVNRPVGHRMNSREQRSKKPLSIDDFTTLLRQRAAAALPVYMRPARYIMIAQMPTTASGKIDRSRLQANESTFPLLLPRQPLIGAEQEICALCTEVLGVGTAIDSTFLECGGDSLTAVQMVARIRARYGIELSIQKLLNGLSLRDIATLVNQHLDQNVTSLQ
jgi:amino acid adenylation domain-containing protein